MYNWQLGTEKAHLILLPKYWVMRWKNSDDVVIETASKALIDAKAKAEKIYTQHRLEDSSKYEFILIELSRVLVE